MAVSDDDVALRIREKYAKKQEKAKEQTIARAEAVEQGEKRLHVERTPNGLYYCLYRGGGQLPEELKGRFTSIEKLRQVVINRYGKDILAWQ